MEPMPEPRIRIFSDIHFGDPSSAVRDLDALRPLFGDADRIILNGDTLDTVTPQTGGHLVAVRAFVARNDLPPITLLTGNHDPDITDQAELSLRDGRVWVTHGDVLFNHIAPWSRHAEELKRRLDALARDIPAEELDRIETRLRLNRRASHDLPEPPDFFNTHPLAGLSRLVRTLFPPRRLVAMLRAWREAPRRAADLARAHRPDARLVVMGHTHHPGVWRPHGPDGVVVVNTGSFSRPFGGAFVELCGDDVRVTRIRRGRDGFSAGRVLAHLDLAN